MATDLSGVAPRRRASHPVRWIAIAVAAAVLLPMVVVLGNRLASDTGTRSPLVGKPAPSFSVSNIDGGTITSEQLAGRPYVVNFWASWCVPCRQEHPNLEAFYRRYRPQGVEMLGVIFSDKVSNARRYRNELGGDWPLLEDPKGRLAIDFGVTGPPETFVVDSGGIIVAKIRGAVGPGALEEVLEQIF